MNGASSSDKVVGWGEPGGYVYQKAYIEFFASPENILKLKKVIKKYPTLSFHAVNMKGDQYTNAKHRVNAVTWGVFPDSEIIQPTVVCGETFAKIWKVRDTKDVFI